MALSKRQLNFQGLFEGMKQDKHHLYSRLYNWIHGMGRREKMLIFLLLVVVISTVLKFIYVFKFTDYPAYLNDDMGGYWERAFEHYNGNIFDINQWVIWPPFYHVILANIFKITEFFGIFFYNLEIVLSLNIILSSISVIYLYLITVDISKNYFTAFTAASVYAFTYHSFYFNAFILSENFAVPILIASTYYLFRGKNKYYILSGALLAIATGIRPGYGILGLSMALFALVSVSKSFKKDWKQVIFFKGFLRAALFSVSFFCFIFLILVENNYISRGRMEGLGSSGGVNYYLSFTKQYEVRSQFDGYLYVLIPPGTVENPENGKLLTDVPIYDGKYFNGLANEYIKENPQVLLTKLSDVWKLYFGILFPSYGSALWFDQLIIPFRWAFFILSLLVVFSLFIRPFKRRDWGKYLVLLSIILFSIVVCYFFNSEHRYLYAFIFAVYPLAFESIFEIIRNFKKYWKKLIIFASILLGLVLLKAGISQVKKYNTQEKLEVAVLQNLNLHDTSRVYVDAINFPFNKEFTHNRLGKLGYKDGFQAIFTTDFEITKNGFVEFLVYSENNFELYIDSSLVMSRYMPSDEKENSDIRIMGEGKHSYKLVYYHFEGDPGIKAMYIPTVTNDIRKYFVGEDTEFVKFTKPTP